MFLTTKTNADKPVSYHHTISTIFIQIQNLHPQTIIQNQNSNLIIAESTINPSQQTINPYLTKKNQPFDKIKILP